MRRVRRHSIDHPVKRKARRARRLRIRRVREAAPRRRVRAARRVLRLQDDVEGPQADGEARRRRRLARARVRPLPDGEAQAEPERQPQDHQREQHEQEHPPPPTPAPQPLRRSLPPRRAPERRVPLVLRDRRGRHHDRAVLRYRAKDASSRPLGVGRRSLFHTMLLLFLLLLRLLRRVAQRAASERALPGAALRVRGARRRRRRQRDLRRRVRVAVKDVGEAVGRRDRDALGRGGEDRRVRRGALAVRRHGGTRAGV